MGVKNCHHIISYPIDFQVSHLYSNIISNPYKIHDVFFWCSGGVCKLENSLWNLQPTSQDSIDAGSLYLLKCFFFSHRLRIPDWPWNKTATRFCSEKEEYSTFLISKQVLDWKLHPKSPITSLLQIRASTATFMTSQTLTVWFDWKH